MERGGCNACPFNIMGLIFDAIKLHTRGTLYDLERISHIYQHESLGGEISVMARADDGTTIQVYRTDCSISANHMQGLLEELIDETKALDDDDVEYRASTDGRMPSRE